MIRSTVLFLKKTHFNKSNFYAMRLHFLILSIILFFQLQAYGQALGALEKEQKLDAISTLENQAEGFDYAGVEGSPFLYDDWVEGEIVLEDSTVYDEIPLRYDVYHNALIAKRGDGAMIVDKDKIRGFTLGKPGISNFAHFLKASYLEDFQRVPADQFVQVFYDGPSALYAINRKSVVKANQKRGNSAEKPDDDLSSTEIEYYLRAPEGDFVKVKPEKKFILKVFNSKKQEVEEFINKNNLVLEEGTDLVKVLMFYDQLNS